MKYNRKRLNLKNFKFLETIGIGRTSQIKLALNYDNKKHYIVKVFQKLEMIKKNYIKRIAWELRILSNLKSPLFPEFYGTAQTTSEFYLFMEFVPGGDFYFWETNMDNISISAGRFYIAQIVLMFEYLHSKLIVYRDLKPENLVLGADGYLKLIDFGSSVVLSDITKKTYSLCGTPEFLSPEVLLKKGHTIAVDYWALGVFLYELYAKEGPFFDENPMKLYTKTIKIEYTFPFNFPEYAKSLVRGFLVKNPNLRLGMTKNKVKDIMDNIFFKDFDWNSLKNRTMSPPIYPKVKTDKDISNFNLPDQNNIYQVDMEGEDDPFVLW